MCCALLCACSSRGSDLVHREMDLPGGGTEASVCEHSNLHTYNIHVLELSERPFWHVSVFTKILVNMHGHLAWFLHYEQYSQ